MLGEIELVVSQNVNRDPTNSFRILAASTQS